MRYIGKVHFPISLSFSVVRGRLSYVAAIILLYYYVLYREYGGTHGRTLVNEGMLIATQHRYCIVSCEVDFVILSLL